MWSEESGRARVTDEGEWTMEEELTYLASGGREGTLLEEVEGLASGEHDECLVF
jgi:hypothetical protein